MADSWKTDGNCAECRRQKYCSKSCTKNRQRIQMELMAKTAEFMARKQMKQGIQYPDKFTHN